MLGELLAVDVLEPVRPQQQGQHQQPAEDRYVPQRPVHSTPHPGGLRSARRGARRPGPRMRSPMNKDALWARPVAPAAPGTPPRRYAA
ncbi:hypothetical protein RB201_16285 [Streptomyces sp. S1A(2023)]